MPPVGFESEIPSSGRPQIHAFDSAATGTGCLKFCMKKCLPELIFRLPNSDNPIGTNLPIFVKENKELLEQKASQENYLILFLQL